MGDIPILGYLFQERLNARTKRNLLVFVTPTILEQRYGTGLEDQVSGLHHSGEEYADPNGWRNNAKGAVRLVPTSNRQIAADYPKPGVAPAPAKTALHEHGEGPGFLRKFVVGLEGGGPRGSPSLFSRSCSCQSCSNDGHAKEPRTEHEHEQEHETYNTCAGRILLCTISRLSFPAQNAYS